MRAAPLALVLLLLALLAPVASADHVYSHRYVVLGRVVDADGRAVANVTVGFAYHNFTVEGPCGQQPNTTTEAFGRTQTTPVTNEMGEFMFCAHTHILTAQMHPEGAIRVLSGAPAAETRFALDPDMRQSYVVVRLPERVEAASEDALARVATVEGRAWRFGPTSLEAIPVNGTTVNRVPVNLTLLHDGREEAYGTTTNNYGDFAVRFNLTAPLSAAARVRVEILGDRFEAPYDAALGVAYLKLNMTNASTSGVSSPAPGSVVGQEAPPPPASSTTSGAAPASPSGEAAPTSTEPPKATPGVGLVLLVLAVALVALARAQTRGGA